MAKKSLEGKWLIAIGAFLLYIIINIGLEIIPVIGPITGIIISGPFILGISFFSLNLSRNKEAKLEDIFFGFNNFKTALIVYIIIILKTVLWLLLLIIPGIIVGISYSMTFYILADNNSIDAIDAMNRSRMMMNGYKWKFFNLALGFLGLTLLCILTLGIGLIWLIPYVHVTLAKFYDDIKSNTSNIENK